MSPLARTRGVREVSATCDIDSVAKADCSLMFPEVLRLATREGISARLILPHVCKVLQGAQVGKDVESCAPVSFVPLETSRTSHYFSPPRVVVSDMPRH